LYVYIYRFGDATAAAAAEYAMAADNSDDERNEDKGGVNSDKGGKGMYMCIDVYMCMYMYGLKLE
jgi:hypothetical protein